MNELIKKYTNELKNRQLHNNWYDYGFTRQKIFQKYLDNNKDILGLMNFYDTLKKGLDNDLNIKIDIFVNNIKDNFTPKILQKFVINHHKNAQFKAFYLDFNMYELEIFACKDFNYNTDIWASDFYDSQTLLDIGHKIDYDFDGFSDAITSDYINAYVLKLILEALMGEFEGSYLAFGYAQSDYPIVNFNL